MESERDRLIREKAYQLWEDGGRRDGAAETHWAEAERSFAAGSEGSADLPPAALSDAPAAKKPRKAASAAGESAPAEAKPAKAPAKGRGKGAPAGGAAGA